MDAFFGGTKVSRHRLIVGVLERIIILLRQVFVCLQDVPSGSRIHATENRNTMGYSVLKKYFQTPAVRKKIPQAVYVNSREGAIG